MRHLFDQAASASLGGASLAVRSQEVARRAALDAEIVDKTGLFPRGAIDAARRAKLLSLLVPTDLGGEGATVSEAAEVCSTIARCCASAAMIIAMHFTALACVIRHRHGSPWHETLLRRIAMEECLLASSTTEGNEGGNVRSSLAPLIYANDQVTLERAATVISYGAEADGIVTTARRGAGSSTSDQALAVFMKQDYSLTETGAWQTLGMRGTRSAGFALRAAASGAQVLPTPYKTIHARTMVPVSHLLWCSVWIGIATDAATRAQAFVRTAARRAEGRMPPGASCYTRAISALTGLRARLVTALTEFERIRDDVAALDAVETQTAFNLLKVDVSEGALAVVSTAMRTCGLAGYREDGDFSIARHFRDVLSAPIMIHNERILANVTTAALVSPAASSLGAR